MHFCVTLLASEPTPAAACAGALYLTILRLVPMRRLILFLQQSSVEWASSLWMHVVQELDPQYQRTVCHVLALAAGLVPYSPNAAAGAPAYPSNMQLLLLCQTAPAAPDKHQHNYTSSAPVDINCGRACKQAAVLPCLPTPDASTATAGDCGQQI